MSVTAGLEVGGPEPTDPFAAALESKGVTGGGDSSSLSVSSGLTFEGQEPATAPAATADDGTNDEGQGGDEPLHENEQVAAYLARFGGDVDKALESAVNAQSLLGKQGNELGELRQTVAKLEGMVEQISRTPVAPAQQYVAPSADSVEDALIEDPFGFITAQINAGAPDDQVERLLRAWGQDDGYSAALLRQEWQQWKATPVAPPAATEPDPVRQYTERQIQAERMGASMDAVSALPEFAGEFEGFKNFIPAALEASGKIVAKALTSQDDEEQQDALKIVYRNARLLANDQAVKDAADASSARRTVGKQTARVMTSQAGTPPPPPASKEDAATTRDAEIRAFKDGLLGANTASVTDGLTFGNAR